MIDTVNPFDPLAAQYDAWFDTPSGRSIFYQELDGVRFLLQGVPRPWLEVGVGTGRFAERLGIEDGIDPSTSALKLASARGIRTTCGDGECLPYSDSSFGCVLVIATLCFVSDPQKTLQECRRVLKDNGYLIIGFIPAESFWGKSYAEKSLKGHPFYSRAKFYSYEQVLRMARSAGFRYEEARSCLIDPPGTPFAEKASSQAGIVNGAGFVIVRFLSAERFYPTKNDG
jgi:ubiquinone/menaquinone biosynthesis C-methylase UbiE